MDSIEAKQFGDYVLWLEELVEALSACTNLGLAGFPHLYLASLERSKEGDREF